MAKQREIGANVNLAQVSTPSPMAKWSLLIFITIWFSFQILFPLRHLLYPGSPSWTEEGHRFAWQMKLRDKDAEALFIVIDHVSQKGWPVQPEQLLMRHQARKVASRPDLILQFAHHLAEVWDKEANIKRVEVRARVCASLNGRRAQLLIDPNRDLTQIERSLRHADWILPLTQPFERLPQTQRNRELDC